MSKTLAILGAGELGKQIANLAIADYHYDKILFYDDFNTGNLICGNSSNLIHDFNDKKFNELIIGIGYNFLKERQEKFKLFCDKIPFGIIIHSSAWVDSTATINKGCVIYPRTTIDKNVIIHSNVIINLNCVIAHDSVVHSHTFLSPGVNVAGFVTIGECCNIGISTTIIDNINIVDNTQTGGGTVVIKDITNPGLYVGNTAKFIR
ncbi:MAG: acetyltransferase [Bacteroidia bacterium]